MVNLPLNFTRLDRAVSTQPYSPDLLVDRSVTACEKGLAAPVTFGPQPDWGRSPIANGYASDSIAANGASHHLVARSYGFVGAAPW